MRHNHKRWLQSIYQITLLEKNQTRQWLSKFQKLCSKQLKTPTT